MCKKGGTMLSMMLMLLVVVVCSLLLVVIINLVNAINALIGNFEKGGKAMKTFIVNVVKIVIAFIKAYYYNVVNAGYVVFSGVRSWWRKGKKYEIFFFYFTRRAERNFRLMLRNKKRFWNNTKKMVFPVVWNWLTSKRNINYFSFLCNQRGSIGLGLLNCILTVVANDNKYVYTIVRRSDYETIREKEGTSNQFGGTQVEQQLACVIAGLKHAITMGMQEIDVQYTFDGIRKWATGEWKAKKPVSQWYVEEYTKLVNQAKINFVYGSTLPKATITREDIEKSEKDNDNLEINDKWTKAKTVIENGESLFVHGKAGTGKSTFLKWLIGNVSKHFLVLAPTGIAALNINGKTIHSAFKLGYDSSMPKADRIRFNMMKNAYAEIEYADIIVIDEVSMVRCDLMNTIDALLRIIIGKDELFGGKQIIFMGDLYQLPPVLKQEEETEFYKNHKGRCFLYADVFKNYKIKRVEFEKIYRQQGDMEFTHLLNNIRINENPDKIQEFINNIQVTNTYDRDAIVLCDLNAKVDRINQQRLREINAEEIVLRAIPEFIMDDEEIKRILSVYKLNNELIIKKGAKIITLVNNPEQGYMNGTICSVLDIDNNKIHAKREDGIEIEIKMFKFPGTYWDKLTKTKQDTYVWMYPIRLAWAVTIHKSQGQTFNTMNLDIRGTWEPGQLYVALSRCKSLNGIRFIVPINSSMVIVDKTIKTVLDERTINIDPENPTTPINPEPPTKETEVSKEIFEEVEESEIIDVEDISEENEIIPVEEPIQENKIKEVEKEVKMETNIVPTIESKLIDKVLEAIDLINELGAISFMKEMKKGTNYIEKIDNILKFYVSCKNGVNIQHPDVMTKYIIYSGILKVREHTKNSLKIGSELLVVLKEYISKGLVDKAPDDMLEKLLKSLNEFIYGGINFDYVIKGKEGKVLKVIHDTLGTKAPKFPFETELIGQIKVKNEKDEEKYINCEPKDLTIYHHEYKKNLPKFINIFENYDMYQLYTNSIIFVTNDTKYQKGQEVKMSNEVLISYLIPIMKKHNLTFAPIANENVLYVIPRKNNIVTKILDSYKFRKEFYALPINKRIARFSKIVNGRTFHISLEKAVISETFPKEYEKLNGKEGVIYIDTNFMIENGIRNGDKIMKYGKSLVHGIVNLKATYGIDIIFPEDENKLKISIDLIKELGLFIWSYRADQASKEEKDAASIWALLSLGVIDTEPEENLKKVKYLKDVVDAFYKREIDKMAEMISFKKDDEEVEDNVIKALRSGNYTTTLLQVIEKKLIDKLRKIYQNFRKDKIMARVMPLEALYLDGGSRETRKMVYGQGLIIRYPCHHFIFGSYVYDKEAKIVYVDSELWMKYTGGDFDGDLIHVFPYKSIKDVRDADKRGSATNYIFDFASRSDREKLDKYFKSIKTESFEPKSDYYENLEVQFKNVLNNQKNIGEAFRMAMIFRQIVSHFYGEEEAVNASLTLNTSLVQRAIDSIKHNDNFEKDCIFNEFKTFIDLFGLSENDINMELTEDYVQNRSRIEKWLLDFVPYVKSFKINKDEAFKIEAHDRKLFWKAYLFSWFNRIISLATKENRILPILNCSNNLTDGEGLFRIVKNLKRDLNSIGFTMLGYIKNTTSSIFDDVVLLDAEDRDPLYEITYIDMLQNGVLTRYEVQFKIDAKGLTIKRDKRFAIIMQLMSIRDLFVSKTNFGTYLTSKTLPKKRTTFGIKKVEFSNAKFAEAFERMAYNRTELSYGKITYTINGADSEWIKGEKPNFFKVVSIPLGNNSIKVTSERHRTIQCDMKFKYIDEKIIERCSNTEITAIKDMLDKKSTINEIEDKYKNC